MLPQRDNGTGAGHARRPSGPFRYLYWVLASVAGIVTAIGIAALFFPSIAFLSREGGVLEAFSLAFWVGGLLAATAAFFLRPEPTDRLAACWSGLVALLAFLRELDLHVALNPETLGQFGVRYRIDWWLDESVSLWLKAGWLILCVSLLLALLYPPWALRRHILRLARAGNVMVGLLFVAGALSVVGFVCDDLLRSANFLSRELCRLAEETSEMLGSAAFLVSALLRCSESLVSSPTRQATQLGRQGNE